MEQDERERALIKFRNKSCPVLICTDLGSRGLDIPEVKHIVHYQMPDKQDAFVHRNGRTARMAEQGNVYFMESAKRKVGYDVPQAKNMKLPNDRPDYFMPEWTTIYFSAGKNPKKW